MKYVIGVDLGTSAVKVLLVDQTGGFTIPFPWNILLCSRILGFVNKIQRIG